MRTTRMLLFGLLLGGGIGCAVTYLGRWQFVFAALVVAVAATCWGFASSRRPRPGRCVPNPPGTVTIVDVVYDIDGRPQRVAVEASTWGEAWRLWQAEAAAAQYGIGNGPTAIRMRSI